MNEGLLLETMDSLGTSAAADNTPWVEKYRPATLDELVLDDPILSKLHTFTAETLPNLLLFGPPGTGKTTTALILANKLLTDSSSFIELNASDNRGINMISDLVQNFCKNVLNDKIKIIVLDEADNITKKAQQQLINFLENYSNVRIIFTCNDFDQIIEHLQSRCMMLKFSKPPQEQVVCVLDKVLTCEKVTYDPNALISVVVNSENDIRKAIHSSETICNLYHKVDEAAVEKYFRKPSLRIVFQILDQVFNRGDPSAAIDLFLDLNRRGTSSFDFVVLLIDIFQNIENYKVFVDKFMEKQPEKSAIITSLEHAHECYYRILHTVESNLQVMRMLWSLTSPCTMVHAL